MANEAKWEKQGGVWIRKICLEMKIIGITFLEKLTGIIQYFVYFPTILSTFD